MCFCVFTYLYQGMNCAYNVAHKLSVYTNNCLEVEAMNEIKTEKKNLLDKKKLNQMHFMFESIN